MKPKNIFTLITGGTSGIGLELARLFANNGHNLVLVARNEEALMSTAEMLKQQYRVDVQWIVKDLFNPAAAFELHSELSNSNRHINILVNNAGQGQYGEFTQTDIMREIGIIQLNIVSLVVLTKLFLRDMIKNGEGKILNLSSIASKVPGPLQSVYHGTKAFVQSFTEAIREEVKDKKITVTALLPGATATDFFRKADMLQSKIVQEGKLADAAEVARAGYDALMNDDDKVVAGFNNKIQVAMAAVTPDNVLAAKMHKQQEPADKNK